MNQSKKKIAVPTDILQRNEYLNSQELVIACEKQKMPLSRKTLHNLIRDKVLPMGLPLGNEVLFHKEFFMAEIKGMHTLRAIFHVKYDDLKLLAANKSANLGEIADRVYSLVDYFQGINRGKGGRRPLLVNISNDKFLQKVAARFLDEMKKGADFNAMDMKKFVDDSMETE